jgi:hypothetical protein
MRPTVAILVVFAFIVCFTSRAVAAEGNGKIAGKVTSASTEAPIAGIEVCAFPKAGGEGPIAGESGENGEEGSEEEGSEEELFKCPTTGANGEYAISGLPSGEYIVGFGSPFMSGLNYVTQYYNGKSSFAEAVLVTVAAGGTTSGIDAKLAEGGRIAGSVTSSATSAAIAGAIVCAFGASPESGGCTLTSASGEYAIAGLVAGEYKIGFADREYVTQYYNAKSMLSEANPVSVLTGSTVSGIDAALAPKPPGAPVGTTSPSAPSTPIGPTRSMGPSARIKVASAGVIRPGRSSPRLVYVELKCSDAPCHGSVALTVQVVGRHREGELVVVGPETVTLAKGSFSLGAGKSARVALRLTASGRKRLSHTMRHPLVAQLAFSLVGGKTSIESVRAN